MSKRYLLLILTALLSWNSKSQVIVNSDLGRLSNIKSGNSELSTGYGTWYGSNAINNSFVNALFTNKYIDNELKLSNSLKEKSRLGFFDDLELTYSFRPDSMFGTSGYGLLFSMESHSVNHIIFTPDFFNIAFFGNSSYGGKSAVLDDMHLEMMRFQQFRIGIFKQETNFTYFMGLSVLKGQSYSELTTEKSYLFTEESGEYIDFALRGSYFASDSVYRDIFETTGIGASVDLFFNFSNEAKDLQVKLSITNIGFINWNRNSFLIQADTLIHFEGVEIPDILNVVEPDVSGFSGDSLTKIMHDEAQSANFSRALPERLHFSINKKLDKLSLEAGFVNLQDASFKMPLFYINGDYTFAQKYNIHLGFLYGGYGTWSSQMGFKINFKEKFIVRFSANPEAYFFPSNSYHKSLYTGFVFVF